MAGTYPALSLYTGYVPPTSGNGGDSIHSGPEEGGDKGVQHLISPISVQSIITPP